MICSSSTLIGAGHQWTKPTLVTSSDCHWPNQLQKWTLLVGVVCWSPTPVSVSMLEEHGYMRIYWPQSLFNLSSFLPEEFKRNSLSRSAISNKFSQHIADISFRLNIFLAVNLTYMHMEVVHDVQTVAWYPLWNIVGHSYPTFKIPTLLLVNVVQFSWMKRYSIRHGFTSFLVKGTSFWNERRTTDEAKFSSLFTNYRVSNTNYTEYDI